MEITQTFKYLFTNCAVKNKPVYPIAILCFDSRWEHSTIKTILLFLPKTFWILLTQLRNSGENSATLGGITLFQMPGKTLTKLILYI